ncbi:hypothetical protein LZZ85_27940 [Terrimonas sp. NA20]|uniref:Lipoprotein n=1 Tax=Terrimonas ginsenosidimutans TaxID=2908004 RepID=A0ABS9L0M1_9BACT|nr:hypothetical protein [Terrimonas ginsenosidimutans]MCG2618164.1 hypothetical protein [Terrimonas ginsenosidimutans]
MKNIFLYLLSMPFFLACTNGHDKKGELKESNSVLWNNKYEVFDEPDSKSIEQMNFYILLVSSSFLDTLTILSIRQNAKSVEGFYKKIPYDQIPALFENTIETKTFRFSTIRFSTDITQVDSIKGIIKQNDLFSLKDTIRTNATDGSVKEIMVYDGKRFYDFYRGYVFDKDVESKFVHSFEKIMKLAPSEQIP